jgi:hypothetical protein
MNKNESQGWHWPQELWKKFLSFTPFGILKRAEALKSSPIEVQFSLSHVFIRELLEQFEAFTRLESLDESLTALSKHQVEVFIREQLGMPLHPGYFMELSQKSWQESEISLHDSFYLNQENMLTRSKRGVSAASTPEQKRRYELETTQIERLQEALSQELSDSKLTRLTEGELSTQVRQRYPGHQGEVFTIGRKLLTTMPKSKVHAGDKAYVSAMQALYLPSPLEAQLSPKSLSERIASGNYLGRIITVSDSLFYDLTDEDLADTHKLYNPLTLQPQEDILMQVVTRLPPELSSLWGRQIFIDLSKRLVAQESAQSLSRLLARQQAREQDMRRVQPMIEESARFLAHVLLLELARATVNDPEFLEFPTRLYYAFGLVASPLLQRLENPHNNAIFFSYDIARENYLKTHNMPSLTTLKPGAVIDPQLRDKVIRPEFLQGVKKIQMTRQQKSHYNEALGSLPKFYLNQVVGNTLCNAFSFGQFAEGRNLFQMPLAQNIMSGMPVQSLADVRAILGDGAEGWHLGSCRNPECPNKGLEQMVGLCDICLHCQLQSEYADYQSSTNEGEATQPDLSRQMLGSYSTLDAVTRDAKRSLSAGLFLPYLLQENLIGNMASTRGQR